MLITSVNQAFVLQNCKSKFHAQSVTNYDGDLDDNSPNYLPARPIKRQTLSSTIYKYYTLINRKRSINQSDHFPHIPGRVTTVAPRRVSDISFREGGLSM